MKLFPRSGQFENSQQSESSQSSYSISTLDISLDYIAQENIDSWHYDYEAIERVEVIFEMVGETVAKQFQDKFYKKHEEEKIVEVFLDFIYGWALRILV